MSGGGADRSVGRRTPSAAEFAKDLGAARAGVVPAPEVGMLAILALTDLAEEARRRSAAGKFLRRLGVPKLTRDDAEELQARIESEVAASKRKRKKHSAA